MSEALRPCPLCGGEVGWRNGAIQCDRCRLSLRVGSYELTNNTWNTRAERTCRWVPGKMHYGERRPKCSECGYGLGDSRWLFCPNCGAKVVG